MNSGSPPESNGATLPVPTEPVTHPVPEDDPWQPGTVLLGEYTIRGLLGRGGMGAVYLVQSRVKDADFYAVKTLHASRLAADNIRRVFLREIRTWIDLPPHPNLTECLFVRTIGDRLAIFAEYVPGGTLNSWIQGGRLLSLDAILDVAIQFAWGLHAAHSHGVVHQDVKPGNLLLTHDRIAKVTDFGLSNAHSYRSGTTLPDASDIDTVLVSSRGMTPAYSSPEQISGSKLSRRSDIWSYGLSVLEMFAGSVFWRMGVFADRILNHYLDNPPADRPMMPGGCVDVLRKCFREDPRDRWASMSDVADALKAVYAAEENRPYPRKTPGVLKSKDHGSTGGYTRRSVTGTRWDDPVEWMHRVYTIVGREIPEGGLTMPVNLESRRARIMADLEKYQEVRDLFQDAISDGRTDLQDEFSLFLVQMAMIHKTLGDGPGALAVYDEVIRIAEGRVAVEQTMEIKNNLAGAYVDRALVMGDLGDEEGALVFYEKAVKIRERLVFEAGNDVLRVSLGKSYMNMSNALGNLGRFEESIAMCDKAIAIFNEDIPENQAVFARQFAADAHMNKGVSLFDLGRLAEAVRHHDMSIAITESLLRQNTFADHGRELALARMNKAMALNAMENYTEALNEYRSSVSIYQKLLAAERKDSYLFELARVLLNQSGTHWFLSDFRGALATNNHAVTIFEELVFRRGHKEYQYHLALVYMNKALFQAQIELNPVVMEDYGNAMEILERLVFEDHRTALTRDLVLTYSNAANAMLRLKDTTTAERYADRAEKLAETWVHDSGHTAESHFLALAYHSKASVRFDTGNFSEAVEYYDRAIQALENLVERYDRHDWDEELATYRFERLRAELRIRDSTTVRQAYQAALETLTAMYAASGSIYLKQLMDDLERNPG